MRALLLLPVLLAGCAPPAATPTPAPTTPAPERRAERPPPVDERRVVRLGVLLPSAEDGYLRQYADAVLEGVQVAIAERAGDPRFRVETVVREGNAASGVQSLAEAGVVAIIAPLPDPQVAAAARARPSADVAVIGPTAITAFEQPANVYALNVPDTLGAAALGAHAARRGLGPAGVLHGRDAALSAQARAFVAAYRAAGGSAPLELSYAAGTTSFGSLLQRLKQAHVRAIFVAADERHLRQILPQVSYYGLEGAQLLATGAWATPDGVERIGRSTLRGALITLPFLPSAAEGGWQSFERAYEAEFRRGLPNAIPALGYDAARLALSALGARGTAAEVSSALAGGAEVEAATGRLRTARGSVLREPRIVRVTEEGLIPVNGGR